MYKKLESFQSSALWKGFYKANGYLISICGVGLTAVIFIGVVMRYVLKKDFYGSEEIILLFAWWMYFMGGIGGSQEDSHIKADMIDVFCTNKFIVDLFRGIAKAVEAVVFFFCTYLTFLLLQTNFVKWPVTTGLKIPYVASQIPLFIGFLGMAVFAVYWAFYYISKAFYEQKEGGSEA